MENGSSHRVQIIVAVLGLVGVLATAILSNWDKFFPAPPPPTVEPTRASVATPSPKPPEPTSTAIEPARAPAATPSPKASEPTTAAGKVLFKESFGDNANGWAIWKPGSDYDAYLEDGEYVIEPKVPKNAREVMPMTFQRPENFDLELSAIWKSGVNNHRYGLVLGSDAETYYTFGASGNGQAVVGLNKGGAGEGVPDPIGWKPKAAREGDGVSFNKLKIEVRGDKISYYVNDRRIGEITNAIIRDKWAIGVMVQDKQKVAFDDLVLTAR
ncbi:MAG: hypothetical protein MUC51_11955 [Anaerolineae bacterium]|jgi:hypothetical protein|nr:hypothetical protein [Anaerolineae bacterium]